MSHNNIAQTILIILSRKTRDNAAAAAQNNDDRSIARLGQLVVMATCQLQQSCYVSLSVNMKTADSLSVVLRQQSLRPVNASTEAVEIPCSRPSGDVHCRSKIIIACQFVAVA